MLNETLTAIKERYSCKSFSEQLPEMQKIEMIAQSAITSPSATNKQPWQVIVVMDKKLIQEIEDETFKRMGEIPTYKNFHDMLQSTRMKLFYNAPCMIVIPIDKENPYSCYDCGIVAQTICISAQSLGLGSHIIAINDIAFSGEKADYFKKSLKFQDGYEFGLAVLIGNETTFSTPHEPNLDKITYI